MALARRTYVWLGLTAAGVVSLLVITGMVLWMFLPRWAPYWVIDHSPFVEPVVRAWAHVDPAPVGTPESQGGFPGSIEDHTSSRLDRFGVTIVPTLVRLLHHSDPDVRLHALKYLRLHNLPSVEVLHNLTQDVNPWVRLAAWERLKYEPVEVRYIRPNATTCELVTNALNLLNDGDGFIRSSICRDLLEQDSLPLRIRHVLVWQTHQAAHLDVRDHLQEVLLNLCLQERQRSPTENLSSEWVFLLLKLIEGSSEAEALHDSFVDQLRTIDQDIPTLYTRLVAMNLGHQPWEPGADPWMYELLHELFTEHLTISSTELEVSEVATQLFPRGNVIIDPQFIARASPPITIDVTDRTAIEVLQELTKQLEGNLRFMNGVAVIAMPGIFKENQMHGFVPTPIIRLESGVDEHQAAIVAWRQVLKRRFTISKEEMPLVTWLAMVNRQTGLPIKIEGIQDDDGDGPVSVHLRDLPLEQILRFIAGYWSLRIELGETGIRVTRSAHGPVF